MKPDLVIIISAEQPLSTQCRKITGDPFSLCDFEELKGSSLITHIKTGLIIQSYTDREIISTLLNN